MNNPLVSIIVTSYNHEKYIGQTISNILSQKTNFDFELIIADDCSEDSSLSIINKYKNDSPDKIKVLKNEKNIGFLLNYTQLIFNCNGKYIAECASDDYWCDEYKLQKQVDLMEQNPEIGIIFTDYYEQKYLSERLIKRKLYVDMKLPFICFNFFDLIKKNFIATPTVMFKNGVFDFNEILNTIISNKWMMEDYPLWLEISRKHKIGYLREVTAVYRSLGDSVRQTNNIYKQIEFINSYHEIQLYYIEKEPVSDEIKEKIEINYHKSIINCYYRLNNVEKFKDSLGFLKGKVSIRESLKYLIYNFSLHHPFFIPLVNKMLS